MNIDPISMRNEKIGKKVCDTLNSRGFSAFYCATKEEALSKALLFNELEQTSSANLSV